jgi:hypothetical protein
MILGVRAYMFTIRHQVTNKTNSHNAGPLLPHHRATAEEILGLLIWCPHLVGSSSHSPPAESLNENRFG